MKLERKTRLHGWKAVLTLACLAIATSACGQTNVSFQYFYDDLGQLTKVVDSTGTIIEYVYDPVGNILQIKRSSVAPTTLAIFNFTPQSGGPTQTVTIQGQAFDPMPANDSVQFNGTTSQVLSASPTVLTVAVPVGAATGPISVTVGGQTATSTNQFTVIGSPVITGMSCKSALFNKAIPNLQVSGFNLNGATFAFAPALTPLAILISSVSINPSGTSASISLATENTAGTYTLVATNSVGSSSLVASTSNRFTVVNPFSVADSSGNGFPDVLKAGFCLDILDPNSIPPLDKGIFEADSQTLSLLNSSPPSLSTQLKEADSLTVSLINGVAPPRMPTAAEADGLTLSLLNGAAPPVPPKIFEADSLTVSISNTAPKATNGTSSSNAVYASLNQHPPNLHNGANSRKRSSAKPKQRKRAQSNEGE